MSVVKNHNVLWYVKDENQKIVYVSWYEHQAIAKMNQLKSAFGGVL